jgi:tetratricopeptide (TPR) repeat protein
MTRAQVAPQSEAGHILSAAENERIYRMNYDQTFRACVDTLRRLDSGGAKMVRYNEGMIVFQRPENAGALTVVVAKVDGDSTRVEMTAKKERKYWFDGADSDLMKIFFEELDKTLGSLFLSTAGAETPQQSVEKTQKTRDAVVVLEHPQSVETARPVESTDPPAQPPEDEERKKLLVTELGQALRLGEDSRFLLKLSDEELSTLLEKVKSTGQTESGQSEIADACAACYIDLARVYHDSGQYALGAEALKMAVAVAPDNAVAHCNLGEIYKHLNLFDDAIRELNIAKTLQPGLVDIYINLGIIYDDYVPDNQKALEYYRQYLSLGGSDRQVLEWVAAIEKGS